MLIKPITCGAPARVSAADSIVIVTGGSRGIGRSVVQRLARDGLSIVVGYGSNLAAAASLSR